MLYHLYNKLLRITKFKMQLGGTLFHFSTTYYAILLKMLILRLCWSLLILPKSFDQEKIIWETKHSDFSFRYISCASLLKRYVFTIQFWEIIVFFPFFCSYNYFASKFIEVCNITTNDNYSTHVNETKRKRKFCQIFQEKHGQMVCIKIRIAQKSSYCITITRNSNLGSKKLDDYLE